MNKNQKVTIAIGASLFLLMGLFPPWLLTMTTYAGVKFSDSSHYGFLFSPPKWGDSFSAATVDISRLLLQWFLVIIATGVAVLFLKAQKQEQ